MSTADEIRLMAAEAERRLAPIREIWTKQGERVLRARILWVLQLQDAMRSAQFQLTYTP